VKSALFESTAFLVSQHMAAELAAGEPPPPMPAPTSRAALGLLRQAGDGLAEAHREADPLLRYPAAYLAALRAADIRAELYLGQGKFGAQMKYADKRGSPCAVIQGGDEKARGEVQIKDLILGGTLAATKDRDEYLKKQAEAQFAVKETALVEAVRSLLAKHKLG